MTEQTYTTADRTRYLVVAAVVVLAFFAAYGFAASRTDSSVDAATYQSAPGAAGAAGCPGTTGAVVAGDAADPTACGSTGSVGGGACCGTGTPAEAPEGATSVESDIQRIAVDVSKGYFDPTVIRAKAGLPIELTFSEGSGCLAEVMFPDFDVHEDLTSGGAVVTLPALAAGEYGFSCGMQMVFGTLVVE